MSSHPITQHQTYDPLRVQTVSTRPLKRIEIVGPDPTWPATFQTISQRIKNALGDNVLCISHVGSTSVPGMPAKDVIDVDVTVPDPTAEAQYVPALERAGFQFLYREPEWHEHRFFGLDKPYANVHVFGPDSLELVRHKLFRDWLCEHVKDREKYASAKVKAAEESRKLGENVDQYNDRKEAVIREILKRIYEAYGMIELGDW